MLTTELEGIVEHLRRLNRPVVDLMQPGIGSEVVSLYVPGEVPLSIMQWFAWCNGVESRNGQLQDDVNIIPGYTLVSLREAVELRPIYDGDAVLGEHFLPLMTTAGADIYAAVWECDGEEARVAGVLEGESTEIEFGDLDQMVSMFNACYVNGAFFVDRSGRLSMDPELYDATYLEISGRG
jgi:hypothetical protein